MFDTVIVEDSDLGISLIPKFDNRFWYCLSGKLSNWTYCSFVVLWETLKSPIKPWLSDSLSHTATTQGLWWVIVKL